MYFHQQCLLQNQTVRPCTSNNSSDPWFFISFKNLVDKKRIERIDEFRTSNSATIFSKKASNISIWIQILSQEIIDSEMSPLIRSRPELNDPRYMNKLFIILASNLLWTKWNRWLIESCCGCSIVGEICWWKIYIGEKPVCWENTFTNMQVLERRDVGEMYVGEIVCW